jgi:transposase
LRIIGERLSDFVCDEDFADLYPPQGQPGLSPALLAMVTVLQNQEKLTDRQAAAMVVCRLDWKYALHLPLDYAGFHYSVLCEFRDRLEEHQAEERVLGKLLDRLKGTGFACAGGRQRTDAFGVLSAVRVLNRLELVWETVRVTLCALEKADLAWLREAVPLSWADRYGQRGEQARLVRADGEEGKRQSQALAKQVGLDGLRLLGKLDEQTTPERLRHLDEVQVLRQVWAQQYEIKEGALAWLEKVSTPRAEVIQTPHDPDVRYATKRGQGSEGYKVHVTETADAGQPRIITDVQTTLAPIADYGMAEKVQERLKEKGLLPKEHQVDSGYVTGEALAVSKEREVVLLGRIAPDPSAQSRLAGGIALDQFQIDRDERQAKCPGGAVSVEWAEREEDGKKVTQVRFDGATCAACRLRALCMTGEHKDSGRSLTLSAHHELIQQRRKEQTTPAFKEACNPRAGIEGTLSEMSRAHGLRRARYCGLARVHLQHVMIAVAANLKRMARWWGGEKLAETRGLCLRGLAASAAA